MTPRPLAVVPDPETPGAYAIEVGGQPLITAASMDLCQLIAYRYRNPDAGGAADDLAVLAEGIRRWSHR